MQSLKNFEISHTQGKYKSCELHFVIPAVNFTMFWEALTEEVLPYFTA